MVERLLFDRIDTETGALAVSGQHHFAVAVLPDKAKAAITRLQTASTRAEIADHPPVARFVPPTSREATVFAEM